MPGRTIGAFASGFAVGILALGLGLWSSGALRTSWLPPWLSAPHGTAANLPAPPADLQSSAKLPAPPVPPPPNQQPAEPANTAATSPASTQGSAERGAEPGGTAAAAAPHLAMPLAGLNPAALTDTFHEIRDGHTHEALDLPAPRGTAVHAVAEGNVVKLFTSKEGGLTVYQFDDSGRYCFYYAHLDRYARGLKEGTLLRAGNVLGNVGTTGDAPPDAPHLHFAVFRLGPDRKWWKGTALDPLPLLR